MVFFRIVLRIVLFGALALGLLAGLTHPWWLPGAAGWAAARAGWSLTGLATDGYRTLTWDRLEGRIGPLQVTVDDGSLPMPAAWWQAATPPVVLDRVRLEVYPTEAAPATPDADATVALPESVDRILGRVDAVRAWLPAVEIDTLAITGIPAAPLTVEGLRLVQGRLTVDRLTYEPVGGATAASVQVGRHSLRMRLSGPAASGTLGLLTDGTVLRGHADLAGDRMLGALRGTARWSGPGLFPVGARLDWQPDRAAVAAQLPAGVALTALDGALNAEWTEGAWTLSGEIAGGVATPAAEAGRSLDLKMDLAGDTKGVTARSLQLTAPGAAITLAEPFRLDWRGRRLSRPVRIRLALKPADWTDPIAIEGLETVDGQLKLEPAADDDTAFSWAADLNLAGPRLPEALTARGRGIWQPAEGRLRAPELDFAGDRGTALSGEAAWSFDGGGDRFVELAGTLGPVWLERAAFPGETEGQLIRVSASWGRDADQPDLFRVEAGLPTFRKDPFQAMDARVTLTGTLTGPFTVAAQLEGTDVSLAAEAVLALPEQPGDGLRVSVDRLHLGQSRYPDLRLAEPFDVTYHPEATGEDIRWRLDPVALTAGDDGSFRLEGFQQANGLTRLAAEGRAIPVQAFWQYDALPFRATRLETLDLSLDLDPGRSTSPLRLEARLLGSTRYENEIATGLDLTGSWSDRQLTLAGHLTADGQRVLNLASLDLPLDLARGQDGWTLALVPDQPWAARGRIDPGQAIIDRLIADWSPVPLTIRQPVARWDIAGTPEQPAGDLSVTWDSLRLSPVENRPELTIDAFALSAALQPDQLRLDSLAFTLWERAVSGSGRLPMASDRWVALWTGQRLPDPGDAALEASVSGLPVARLAPFLPEILDRQGTLDARFRWRPGAGPAGQLRLHGIALRPIGGTIKISDLSGALAVEGRRLKLDGLTGTWSGQPLSASGELTLAGDPEVWTYRLDLQGTRLPLIQQESLVVRGSPDIRLVRESAGAPAELSGSLTLQNSFFLQDLRDLVQPGTASPRNRPPYFSVTAEPFADWRLDLDVKGEQFLRLQSPVFSGELSADLQLVGTLEEPRALGLLTVDRGQILFPFSKLDLREGEVRLLAENPYNPSLFARAEGRAYGYQIQADVGGTLNQPQLAFTSNPPLGSDATLLMLTTGTIPQRPGQEGRGPQTQALALNVGGQFLSEFLIGSGSGEGGGIAERLSIQSGEELSESGAETVKVEFRVNRRLSLIGQYDQFDDYNLDGRWTLINPKDLP